MSGYAVPVYLPRRRRIVTPAEWLREKLAGQQREREQRILAAITTDQSTLGSTDLAAAASTVSLTTTAPVAVAGTAFFLVTWDGLGGISLSSVDNGCQIVAQTSNATEPMSALVRGYFASGLASSSTVIATFSSASATNRAITACSFTGVADAAATATDNAASGTTAAWTSASLTGSGILISAATLWTRLNSNTPTAPSLEATDLSVANADKDLVLEYRIETVSSSYANAGTWSGSGTQWNAASGFFAAAASGSLETLVSQSAFDPFGFGPF